MVRGFEYKDFILTVRITSNHLAGLAVFYGQLSSVFMLMYIHYCSATES